MFAWKFWLVNQVSCKYMGFGFVYYFFKLITGDFTYIYESMSCNRELGFFPVNNFSYKILTCFIIES